MAILTWHETRMENVTNDPPHTHTDEVLSFNALKVCFIKVPFCIVEWISTESGYFLSTLSAIL